MFIKLVMKIINCSLLTIEKKFLFKKFKKLKISAEKGYGKFVAPEGKIL